MLKLVVVYVAFAAAAAYPSGILDYGLGAPVAIGLNTPWEAAPKPVVVAPVVAVVAPVGTYNYRGPLSLAPGQPANVLAADGRPLDTLSVNLDKAVHFNAKAIENSRHWLKKRSIVSSPVVANPVVPAPLPWSHSVSWTAPAPIPIAAPAVPWGLGVRPVAYW